MRALAFYKLVGRELVETDMGTAMAQLSDGGHVVAQTKGDGVLVSTVSLQTDHSHGVGLPLFFETMVFGGPFEGSAGRCSTYDEAEQMHADACALVFGTSLAPAS